MTRPPAVSTIDIRFKAPYPAGPLSNFAPHRFTMDGVACRSMEGFLQSLKFEDPSEQAEVCALPGRDAQSRGRRRDWSTGTLWWRGRPIDRLSDDYQTLLDRAFTELFIQAAQFRNALAETGSAALTHRMGKSDLCDTILTEIEFCTRLDRLRSDGRLRAREPLEGSSNARG